MYKIFHENKTLIFPKIEDNILNFNATLQESDRYDAELLCDFFLSGLTTATLATLLSMKWAKMP